VVWAVMPRITADSVASSPNDVVRYDSFLTENEHADHSAWPVLGR